MKQTTLERFTEDLKGDAAARLDPLRLAQAKSRGARRRRTRAALVVVAATIVVGGSATLLVPGLDGGGSGRDTVARDVATRPTGLSELQERVLSDVPGAERISVWQVAVPEPLGAVDRMEMPNDELEVRGETFATGVPSYTGVTMYDRAAFPGWLYDGVLATETAAGDEDGQPVGSTDMGIAVVNGTLELACVSFQGADCVPAVIRNEDGQRHYEWGFGTDDFLDPGTGLEVFAGDAGSEDAPSLAVAGLPDDSVTRVEFVNTAGTIVEGNVDHTMAPGSSILWASVPGALARVVTYDSRGAVVDTTPCATARAASTAKFARSGTRARRASVVQVSEMLPSTRQPEGFNSDTCARVGSTAPPASSRRAAQRVGSISVMPAAVVRSKEGRSVAASSSPMVRWTS